MENSDSQKKEEGSQKRSPFDLIMNQIRRKKSFAERPQRSSVSRFFRPSENSEKKGKGISETKESEDKPEDKENIGSETEDAGLAGTEVCSVVGWGRVKQFVQKLGKKPDSRSLSLCNCGLTATDVVELATMLPFLTQLEDLDLSWNDLIGGALKALTFHLQHVNRLKTLKLSNCRLTAEDITALGQAFEYIPLLEELDLSWNSYIGGHLSCLTEGLQLDCRVKTLCLVDCGITADDAKSLGEALVLLPSLEVLDLSVNKHLASGLQDFAPALRHTPRLQVLRLHMCGLKQDSIQTLGSALQHLPDLKMLDLSCNKEAGGGFKEGGAQIATLKGLQSLDLHLCCLTDEDMLALTQVIPLLSDLQELDLSSNKKTGVMIQHLFSRLRFLPKLKSLLINNCNLTEDSYRTLVEAVSQLFELEVLNLSWNKCVGGSLKLLLDPLVQTSSLQVLKLSSCSLTGDDLVDLASVSKSGELAHLRQLDLTYNDTVEDAGWAHFFQDTMGLKELTELDISLRPSTCRDPSPWIDSLQGFLIRLPALSEFGLHRWVLTNQQRECLESFNNSHKRSVHFDCYHSTTEQGRAPWSRTAGQENSPRKD
ncbi:leucine-rich repeat-containing protein 31 isoform X2 [Polyodon spathula]|uniref:leucine-rich repeat-containing protein 31 isoform X2 n=1 Tax=Polyodon spathula TaxID=7913 RepID=UPI001B7E21E3|nr:leucine-rich repeat-containing protein 31 isoform X2 [Polyodon spathula]